MSGAAVGSQPRPDQSVTATALLRQNVLRSVLCGVLVLLSIPLSAGLVGLLLFGGTVHYLLQSHCKSAFETGLLRGRVRNATLVCYLAIAVAAVISIEMLSNVYH